MTIKLIGSSSGSVSIDAPASTTSGADITFKLPVADGSSGQALTTNASGQLAFATVGGANSPCWHGSQDTSQSISSATWTVMKNFADDAVNIGSGWDESEGRFTCQSGDAGIYYIFGYAGMTNMDDGDNIQARFTKNGSLYGATTIFFQRQGNSPMSAMSHIIVSLTTNDYVELEMKHNEGSAEPTGAAYTSIGGYKLIGIS